MQTLPLHRIYAAAAAAAGAFRPKLNSTRAYLACVRHRQQASVIKRSISLL